MEGIIIVNKPKGITSFDVIRKLKKILKTKKIGHTGTLDPLATGVMLVCVGKATKLASDLEAKNNKVFSNINFYNFFDICFTLCYCNDHLCKRKILCNSIICDKDNKN